MGRFEYFDHTADVGITAWGEDLQDAFSAAGLGLFTLMADLDDVREEECVEVSVEADSVEDLLVSWLNELLFVFDVHNLLFKRLEVTDLNGRGLRAKCYGERFDPQRHRLKLGVKGATYHQLSVEQIEQGYRVRVVVDV